MDIDCFKCSRKRQNCGFCNSTEIFRLRNNGFYYKIFFNTKHAISSNLKQEDSSIKKRQRIRIGLKNKTDYY